LQLAGQAVARQGPEQLDVTVDSKPEFLGYEEALYAVEAGLRIRLRSAVSVIAGVRTPQTAPRVPLFQLPRRTRSVRLLIRCARARWTTTWRFWRLPMLPSSNG
jgi:hypothetical protein